MPHALPDISALLPVTAALKGLQHRMIVITFHPALTIDTGHGVNQPDLSLKHTLVEIINTRISQL